MKAKGRMMRKFNVFTRIPPLWPSVMLTCVNNINNTIRVFLKISHR
jgi:hypothetical protein